MQQTKGHILKVLGGAQSGVEVAMGPGEYVLGAGQDDDLQFVDVSLSPGHVRLKIEQGGVFLAGGSGSANTAAGIEVATGDEDWHQVEDLDLIIIGTTSFALGPRDADWSKVANVRDGAAQTPLRAENRAATRHPEPEQRSNRLVWLGAVALCALLGGAVFLAPVLGSGSPTQAVEQRPELEVLQEAFARVPFSHTVALRQEVDGVIFANGYVSAPVERRALINAVEDTGIPVRMRVFVLDSIRQQIDGMIERQELPVSFTLSDTGVVSLSGDILNPEQARRFIARLDTDISGIRQIENQIQTSETYLEAVRKLAERTELHEQVLFRLDGTLIEASGIIGSDKIDNYVGFIQAYARRFADHISLRSLVQLVNESGEVIAMASGAESGSSLIGATENGQGMDLNRLKQGSFNANDVFMQVKETPPAQEETPAVVAASENQDNTPIVIPVSPADDIVFAKLSAQRGSQLAPVARDTDLPDAARRLSDVASDLLAGGTGVISNGVFQAPNGFSENEGVAQAPVSDGSAKTDELQEILPELKFRWSAQGEPSASFLPLIVSPATTFKRCWRNSELTLSNLPLVLFWLDLLSLSDTLDVTDLDMPSQHLLLEAALSPESTAACARRITRPDGTRLDDVSLFLREIQRNPDFIRFIMRNVQSFQLPITGVMTGNGARYVQVTNGLRLDEGASPDPSSKLASVGELGTLIRSSDSMSAVIYGETLAWRSKS
jgi:type III secretion system YscD/HrpQ family protein